ncbi:hypothetical protein AB6A40_007572 [Gnathostoma spinigerum]|uniref:C2H2-type domain-containing protein n=1 Tax=Gnathostoma spinigerum TaxID=75299 RepID=A0ABD6EUY4_9BILA
MQLAAFFELLRSCGGERCPTCDVRCKTVVQLQEHIIEKHCGDLPTELFESIQKAQQRALIAQTAAVVANQREIRESITEVKCQWCNEKFGDEVQRHMHTIHAHSTELRQSHEQLMSSAAPKQRMKSYYFIHCSDSTLCVSYCSSLRPRN